MAMNHRLMRPLAGAPSGTPASLLLRFDGANGSTVFADSSPNGLTVTANGNAAISTAQSKWGGASLALNTGSLVNLSDSAFPDMSTGNWTIEAWVWRPSGIGNAAIVNLTTGVATQGFHFWIGGDHQIRWDNGLEECAIGGAVPTDAWAHIAAVRNSEIVQLYLNGQAVGLTSSTPPLPGPYRIYIGQHGDNDFFSNMYIDDLRIVNGLAVYTSNFTPPAGPLSATVTPQ